jgi:hypothetical protein
MGSRWEKRRLGRRRRMGKSRGRSSRGSRSCLYRGNYFNVVDIQTIDRIVGYAVAGIHEKY